MTSTNAEMKDLIKSQDDGNTYREYTSHPKFYESVCATLICRSSMKDKMEDVLIRPSNSWLKKKVMAPKNQECAAFYL